MNIIYMCSHCGNQVGTLKLDQVSFDKIGWELLTIEERQSMIQHTSNGDVEIRVICEGCEKALETHPNYHELDYFIQ